MSVTVPLVPHPRHGVHEPTSGSPVRRPGVVRRTATTDMLRPEGLGGPLVLACRGRDARTRPDGTLQTLAAAEAEAVVDYTANRRLRSLRTDPSRPGLAELLGKSIGSGFRNRLDAADPALRADHSLLYLLLDDFPVTSLVSGHAVVVTLPELTLPPERALAAFPVDLCAGFAAGGTLMGNVAEKGMPPIVVGPDAPPLTDAADPEGWHPHDPLPPTGMRRARRIDVDPVTGRVEAIFRDSYTRPDGVETVIHEYTLEATASEGVLTACEATPRVLPWIECPGAVASARRLAGRPLDGLRDHVRATFAGTSTCTHLNDMLRALEDVGDLLALGNR
ncbi:DUF2889 domain-containing protein [Actinocorallia sp. A-T 12471]|uniref:DUF2889 domain-containing protein n=1 Tax=Actinocorallia sp. A-T 12471 TaxID=3089813 RepID=UPI0029CCFDB8|nr:DUF2889 domain-containing protein [Actinocorallia sp. A-T 12471]MDX6740900.1 DUF2889 domain-containing protein [Actinocorallia sp. A-T 12471]